MLRNNDLSPYTQNWFDEELAGAKAAVHEAIALHNEHQAGRPGLIQNSMQAIHEHVQAEGQKLEDRYYRIRDGFSAIFASLAPEGVTIPSWHPDTEATVDKHLTRKANVSSLQLLLDEGEDPELGHYEMVATLQPRNSLGHQSRSAGSAHGYAVYRKLTYAPLHPETGTAMYLHSHDLTPHVFWLGYRESKTITSLRSAQAGQWCANSLSAVGKWLSANEPVASYMTEALSSAAIHTQSDSQPVPEPILLPTQTPASERHLTIVRAA